MAPLTVQVDRVSAWAVELPLRHRFTTATTDLNTRRLILVKINAGSAVGWGEAAPVPGHTRESLEDVWDSLESAAVAAITNEHHLDADTAGAALGQATADAAARTAGVSLSEYLGAAGPPLASAAIGLGPDGSPDAAAIDEAAAAGYQHAKLKISPETTPAALQASTADHESITFGLDANGSLGDMPPAYFKALDDLGFAYLEQPGPERDLPWHVGLRELISTPTALDESAGTIDDVDAIILSGAADIINIKPGRFGTIRSLALARRATAAGLHCRVGGLIESGIGRAHAVALAGCAEFSVVGDIAGSDRYFANDLVAPQSRLTDGRLVPPLGPGIGVEVDEEMIDSLSFWSLVAE